MENSICFVVFIFESFPNVLIRELLMYFGRWICNTEKEWYYGRWSLGLTVINHAIHTKGIKITGLRVQFPVIIIFLFILLFLKESHYLLLEWGESMIPGLTVSFTWHDSLLWYFVWYLVAQLVWYLTLLSMLSQFSKYFELKSSWSWNSILLWLTFVTNSLTSYKRFISLKNGYVRN